MVDKEFFITGREIEQLVQVVITRVSSPFKGFVFIVCVCVHKKEDQTHRNQVTSL